MYGNGCGEKHESMPSTVIISTDSISNVQKSRDENETVKYEENLHYATNHLK